MTLRVAPPHFLDDEDYEALEKEVMLAGWYPCGDKHPTVEGVTCLRLRAHGGPHYCGGEKQGVEWLWEDEEGEDDQPG